jgi:hypothetical protein
MRRAIELSLRDAGGGPDDGGGSGNSGGGGGGGGGGGDIIPLGSQSAPISSAAIASGENLPICRQSAAVEAAVRCSGRRRWPRMRAQHSRRYSASARCRW